jgi:hypothetical protein
MAEAPKSNPNQKLPGNWTPDGVSKGKPTGPVRPTRDACQGPRKGGQSG